MDMSIIKKQVAMSTFTTANSKQGLWDFIEKGQADLAAASLKEDPRQLHYKREHNEDTPLHVIAQMGDTAMLAAVLAVIDPQDIDIRNKNGNSALMSAGANGRAEIVEMLLAAGADVNAQNLQGENLLMKTIKGMNQDDVFDNEKPAFNRILDTAIAHGAQIDQKTHSGNTAIDMADLFEDDKTIGYLETKLAAQKATPASAAPTTPKAAPAPVSKPA